MTSINFNHLYSFCTEFPEEAWNTSKWYAPQIVNCILKTMAKSGKKLPSNEIVTSVVNDISKAIYENGGISAKKPIDFKPMLERLEHQ